MKRKDILDTLEEFQCVVIPSHENALIGIGEHYSSDGPVAIYNVDTIIQNFIDQGMTEEEAEEYYQFNILDGFVANNQPIFCRGLVKKIEPVVVKQEKKKPEKVGNFNRFGKILDE